MANLEERNLKNSRPGPIAGKEIKWRLATLTAKLQGVQPTEAKLPSSVLRIFRELKEVSRVAAHARAGREKSKTSLKSLLSKAEQAPLVEFGEQQTKELKQLGEDCADEDPYCEAHRKSVAAVLQAGFELDFEERNTDARWTRLAQGYVSERLNVLSHLESVLKDSKSPFDPDSMVPLNPEGGRIWRPGTEVPVLGPGWEHIPEPGPPVPIPNRNLGALCSGWFGQLAAGILNDQYIGMIDRVEPEILCVDAYDPFTEFTAYPKEGESFPSQLPPDVRLYFRDIDITSRIKEPWQTDKIIFTIPTGLPSGAVYLKGMKKPTNFYDPGLTKLCGGEPRIPGELLTKEAPGAVIWIVHTPSIQVFYPLGQYMDAPPPCTPIEITWQADLADHAPGAFLHPDITFEVTINDRDGNLLASGGRAGSFTRTDERDIEFIATVEVFVNGNSCGATTRNAGKLERYRKITVRRLNPSEDCVFKGEEIELEVSIPAQCASSHPREFQVVLRTIERDHHGVYYPDVTEGWEWVDGPPVFGPNETTTTVRVRFNDDFGYRWIWIGVRDDYDAHSDFWWSWDLIEVQIIEGLRLRVHSIETAGHYQRAPILAYQPLEIRASVECAKEPPNTLEWRIIRAGGGSSTALPLEVVATIQEVETTDDFLTGAERGSWTRQIYELRLPDESLESFDPGHWVLEVECTNKQRTERYEFTAYCEVDLRLDQVEVLKGQYRFVDFDPVLDIAVVTYWDRMREINRYDPPDERTSIWPPQPRHLWYHYLFSTVSIGVGDQVFPRDVVTTLAVRPNEQRKLLVKAMIWDDDPTDDWGLSRQGEIYFECGTVHTLQFEIPIIKDIDMPDITKDDYSDIYDPSAAEGLVRVTYKAVPRSSPQGN